MIHSVSFFLRKTNELVQIKNICFSMSIGDKQDKKVLKSILTYSSAVGHNILWGCRIEVGPINLNSQVIQ